VNAASPEKKWELKNMFLCSVSLFGVGGSDEEKRAVCRLCFSPIPDSRKRFALSSRVSGLDCVSGEILVCVLD
jgi:hypothetical protein